MCKTIVHVLAAVILLSGVGHAIGWVDQFDGYPNGQPLNAATTGGIWGDTSGGTLMNWYGDDFDGVSAAVNNSSVGWGDAFRAKGVTGTVTQYWGRFKLAGDTGQSQTGVRLHLASNTNPIGGGEVNYIQFTAVAKGGPTPTPPVTTASWGHAKIAAEKWTGGGGWDEDRVDIGDDYGTTFPFSLNTYYDIRVTKVGSNGWYGEYRVTGTSPWTLLTSASHLDGIVTERPGFIGNYVNMGVLNFSRYGEVSLDAAATIATIPSPADDDSVINLNTSLTWVPGSSIGDVNGHDVYFGLSKSAVTNATVGDPMGVYQGRIDTANFDPGGLAGKKTYYWRVDEVNETDVTIWPGDVWSFNTVDVLEIVAFSPGAIINVSSGSNMLFTDPWDTANGAGLTGDLHGNTYTDAMWLGENYLADTQFNGGTVAGKNWLAYEFDAAYDLETMWVWNLNPAGGVDQGMKNVTIQYSLTGGGTASEWTTLGGDTVQFNIASGSPDYAHNTEIDFAGVKAKYVVITVSGGAGDGWWGPGGIWVGLSELRFHYFAYLSAAKTPVPSDGLVGQPADTDVCWSAGDFAQSHDIFFGTSFDDVNSAVRWPGDVTGNGPVDGFDLSAVVNFWNMDPCGSDPYADLDGDGFVNWSDVAIVAYDWGEIGDPVYKGNTTETCYSPGDLAYNKTYYWRIDERSNMSMQKGEVWSFSTHIAPVVEVVDGSASGNSYGGAEAVYKGTGLTGDLHSAWWPDNWTDGAGPSGHAVINPGSTPGAAWIRFDFDGIYRLGDLWVWQFNDNYTNGYWTRGLRNVTIEYSRTGGSDSSDWTKLSDFEFAVNNPATPDMPHTEEIAFSDAEAKSVIITANDVDGNWGDPEDVHGLAEVRFYGYSPYASNPIPAEGADGVYPDDLLSWTPGIIPAGGNVYTEAAAHDVYIGTDSTEVAASTRGSHPNVTLSQAQASVSYAAALGPGTAYYWRVDEVNASDVPEFVGQVWDFMTIPAEAWNVVPEDGGVTARILYWNAGFNAADVNGHDVYLGTSFNDVDTAGTSSTEHVGRISKNWYDIAAFDDQNGLTLGDTYYWRIDEVNDTLGSPVKGSVQSFIHARRVIFNSDGFGISISGNGAISLGGTIQEQLARWKSNLYDPIANSRVDTVSWCDGSGGNTALYGSEVIEPWGYRSGQSENPPVDGTQPTIMQWIAEGNDPAIVVVEEGHRRGYEVWYSFRINDIHDAFTPEEYPTFKEDNPSWMIGSGQPYGFATALRFDVCDVRDIKYDTILEMFTKYDFDGIELDLLRGPPFFMPNTEPANAHILTTFFDRVRTGLNQVADQRGRPCLVAIRVDENMDGCYLDGFDVNSWVQNDSLDILIMASGAIDINVPDFTAITAGTDVLVYPCLYHHPSGYGLSEADQPELGPAMATNYWYQGGDGIYSFNFWLHGASQSEIYLHYIMGDPADLIGLDKMYVADREPTGAHIEYPHNWNQCVLRVTVGAGESVDVPVMVGEDIDAVDVPSSLELRVIGDGTLDPGDVLTIELNGNPLAQTRVGQTISMTPTAPQVLLGGNTVTVSVSSGSVTIDAVELDVNY